jgi:hypothetical protein
VAAVAVYAFVALPAIHAGAALALWMRIALALAIVFPCGLLMGLCFPAGMRALRAEGNEETLPWVWALAVLISMEASTVACALAGAACYAVAAFLPPRPGIEAAPVTATPDRKKSLVGAAYSAVK